MSIEELRSLLNPNKVPEFLAVASEGEGVFETLKAVARLVFLELKKAGTSPVGGPAPAPRGAETPEKDRGCPGGRFVGEIAAGRRPRPGRR